MSDDVRMCRQDTQRVVGRNEFRTRTVPGRCHRPAMEGSDVCSYHATVSRKQEDRAASKARQRAAVEHVQGTHAPGALRGRCPRCGD